MYMRFSALQRAEIAEMLEALQRAVAPPGFSALQRAEIAEIQFCNTIPLVTVVVSVLFNEPKLLKYQARLLPVATGQCFSALQRAEIAEIQTPA